MARPRKWESDAERKRAKRAEEAALHARRVTAYAIGSPGAPTPESPEEPHDGERAPSAVRAQPGRTEVTAGPRIPSEEEYVAAEVLATKLAISRGLKDHDGKRVERAREYARWRYRGYLLGEIDSL